MGISQIRQGDIRILHQWSQWVCEGVRMVVGTWKPTQKAQRPIPHPQSTDTSGNTTEEPPACNKEKDDRRGAEEMSEDQWGEG